MRFKALPMSKKKNGFLKEKNGSGEMLSVSEHGETRRFKNGYRNDINAFDLSIKEMRQLIIGDNCLWSACRIVINGLNELESVKIGYDSF